MVRIRLLCSNMKWFLLFLLKHQCRAVGERRCVFESNEERRLSEGNSSSHEPLPGGDAWMWVCVMPAASRQVNVPPAQDIQKQRNVMNTEKFTQKLLHTEWSQCFAHAVYVQLCQQVHIHLPQLHYQTVRQGALTHWLYVCVNVCFGGERYNDCN